MIVEEGCRRYIEEGEEVFVPLIEMERRVRGNDELVTKAMFPGYLFFDTEDADSLFYRLKKISGLTKILRTDEEFSPISDEEADIIKQLGGDEHKVILSTGFKEGNRVVITEGPLADFTGKVVHIDRRKRTAVIEVTLLGEPRQIKVGLRVLNREE